MASNSVVLKGTTYNGVSSLEVPKSGGGTALFTDVSDTTAAAADVAAGKWFYNALGSFTEGTASGGGGLMYESGIYTPTNDVAHPTISFTNSHNATPIFVSIILDDDSVASTDSFLFLELANFYNVNNKGVINTSLTSFTYGVVRYCYKSSSGVSHGGVNAISSLTGTSNTSMSYWVSASEFKPYMGSDSRYFRAGSSYKWIAVWAPTN
ncbi:MAG: hypothetical protein J6S36_03695 [Eggerthellaceae bacterium]|nr:hypothetical protein [Eggerthellaceae bacterium]